MPQMAMLCDGGMVSEPYAHYVQNKPVYEYAKERLSGTNRTYRESDRETRFTLLFNSATYALLTARIPLPRADLAYEIYLDDFPNITEDELSQKWSDNGIGLGNTKADYVVSNWNENREVFYEADEHLLNGDYVKAQSTLMDAKGLGVAKSAFTIAMLGFTETACADAHICRYFDIDARSFSNYSATEYQSLVDEIFSKVPDLVDETSTFMAQWITWDVARDSVGSHAPTNAQGAIETHDTFFESIVRV